MKKSRGKSIFIIGLLFGLSFVISGCVSNIAEKIPVKVAKIAAKPILGFGADESKTTLAWIDLQVEEGRLTEEQAAEARKCPEHVIALNELREKLSNPSTVEGKKGLIYFGTVKKYGGDPTATVREHLSVIVEHCTKLLPDDATIIKALSD